MVVIVKKPMKPVSSFTLSGISLVLIYGITAKLSDVLQAEQLNFLGAADFIEATLDILKGH